MSMTMYIDTNDYNKDKMRKDNLTSFLEVNSSGKSTLNMGVDYDVKYYDRDTSGYHNYIRRLTNTNATNSMLVLFPFTGFTYYSIGEVYSGHGPWAIGVPSTSEYYYKSIMRFDIYGTYYYVGYAGNEGYEYTYDDNCKVKNYFYIYRNSDSSGTHFYFTANRDGSHVLTSSDLVLYKSWDFSTRYNPEFKNIWVKEQAQYSDKVTFYAYISMLRFF